VIEEPALVVRVVDGVAEIVTQRQGACSGCTAKKGCGTSLLAAWLPERQLSFHISNDIGARPGDQVVVGLDERLLQRSSLLLYAVPLVGLLAGAVSGERLFPQFGWPSELGAVLLGLLGLIVSLGLVRRFAAVCASAGEGGIRLLRVASRRGALTPDNTLLSNGSQPKLIRKCE
jgi:sigma-E factor negative regulatory protein RseC